MTKYPQGIQNWVNEEVPLIQDRVTFVRAHVRSSFGTTNDVTAELLGRRNGIELPGSPLKPTNIGGSIDILENPSRLQLIDSFYFELPPAWRSDTVEFELQSNSHHIACRDHAGVRDDCKVEVTFTESPAVDVRLVGITWKEGNTRHQPTETDMDEVVQQINSVFPIPSVNWDHPYDIEPVFYAGAPTSMWDFARLNTMLKINRTLDGCLNFWPANCRQYYLGVIVDPPNNRQMNGMAGGIPADVASAYVLEGFTHPHELSHVIGRSHTDYNGQRGIIPSEAGSIYHEPTSGTISQESSGDNAFFGFDINNIEHIYDPDTADLMSYGRPRWPSPWTYTHIQEHLTSRYQPYPFSLAINAGEPAILVSGIVSPTDATGHLGSVYVTESPISTAAPPPGTFSIRFEDSSGQELASFDFEADYSVVSPAAGAAVDNEEYVGAFTLLLPWDINTSRITLLQNNRELDEYTASNNAPSINVLYPNGGESLSGTAATLSWSANDLDGDPLEYVVQYSTDAGLSWQTLVSAWPTTTYQLNLDTVAGTEMGLVRILCSDGFHTSQDQSDGTFMVAKHPPRPNIQRPIDNSLYVGEQMIILEGSAYDNEEGLLDDAALSWHSSLDGDLGVGKSLAVAASSLTEGTHTITLTAQDSNSQIGTASLIIQIYRERPILPASLSVAPTLLHFLATEESGQTAWRTLSIRNSGDDTLTWSAAADQSWIVVDSPDGTAPAELSVAVNPNGLPIGAYSGTITLTAQGAAHSPRFIEITLYVRESYFVYLPILIR